MIGVCVRRGMASRLTGFMRVAHLLPRQRGNVAVDNYRFVNALLWMCRTGLRGGTCRSAMASGSPSAGGSTAGPGTARWNACSRHCRRSGSSPSRSGCPPPDSTSVKVHQHATGAPKKGGRSQSASPGEGGTPKSAWHPTAGARSSRSIRARATSTTRPTGAAHGRARRVDALILPVTAVAGRLTSGQVSRRDGDSFATVNVKLGASDGTSIIILDGLEEGDMVSATAPNLTPGAQS